MHVEHRHKILTHGMYPRLRLILHLLNQNNFAVRRRYNDVVILWDLAFRIAENPAIQPVITAHRNIQPNRVWGKIRSRTVSMG